MRIDIVQLQMFTSKVDLFSGASKIRSKIEKIVKVQNAVKNAPES